VKVRNILILLAILLVLGGIYFVVSRPKPEEPTQPKEYVWDVNWEEIKGIEISLPREGKSQDFIKITEGDEYTWYFEDGSPINPARWGAGPPLLVSGPAAYRVITKDATAEDLAVYGLAEPSMPSMIITITLTDGSIVETDVGDKTPNEQNCYVRAPGTNAVALVDYTWYDVLAGLVLNPPYVPTEE
jgi:hypothetical protein